MTITETKDKLSMVDTFNKARTITRMVGKISLSWFLRASESSSGTRERLTHPDRSRTLKIAFIPRQTLSHLVTLCRDARPTYKICTWRAKTTPWLQTHRDTLVAKEVGQETGWDSHPPLTFPTTGPLAPIYDV